MGGCNLNEEQIRTAIHAQARSYDPPIGLKQRIDARLACHAHKEVITMKKFTTKKIAAAAVLACALTGTVCMAAGKITGLVTTSSVLTESSDFADIAKFEKKADVLTDAPQAFDNGFTFANANIVNADEIDENGNTADSFQQVAIDYEKGSKSISYYVHKGTLSEEDRTGKQAVESDGVTYYYSRSTYLYVPDDYVPNEAERKAEEAGELFISIDGKGTEKETQIFDGISWTADGQNYMLFGMDIDMDADELIEMAKQIR